MKRYARPRRKRARSVLGEMVMEIREKLTWFSIVNMDMTLRLTVPEGSRRVISMTDLSDNATSTERMNAKENSREREEDRS